MKKLIVALGIAIYGFSYGQCNILGKSTMNVNETETFSIDNDIAQCKDCHLWVTIGGNTAQATNNKENKFSITAKQGGREVISLVMLSPNGVVQCSKNIDILDSSTGIGSNKPDCDIDVDNFKEVKYAENVVSLFPTKTENSNYKYLWTATYTGGDTRTSTEKVSQFNYTKENPIQKIKVKIESGKCMRIFTKSYEGSFWNAF